MLNTCFPTQANGAPDYRAKKLDKPPPGLNFENRAFAALFNNMEAFGIEAIWRCYAARMDGYLETTTGEIVLLEMKERLGWGSMQAAGFQLLVGRKVLKLKATRGLIVFERVSDEWDRITPHGAWGQLALHSREFPGLTIGGLQVGPKEFRTQSTQVTRRI